MQKKIFSPQYLLKESRRLLRHFLRTYRDYAAFFSGMILGILLVSLLGRAFYELFDSLQEKELGGFDSKLTAWVMNLKSPAMDAYFSWITHFGDRTVYMILAVVLALYFYVRKGNLIFTLQAVLVLVVAGALSFGLKDLIDRPRPEAAGISTMSFPSGHSMSSIAFYGFLIHLSWQIYKSRIKKVLITLLLVFLILSIGLSRVYLQVHYPSDVLAGFSAGGACLVLFILLFSFMRFRQRWKGEDRQPDTATAEEA